MPDDYVWVKQEESDAVYDKHGGLQPNNDFTPEQKLGTLYSLYVDLISLAPIILIFTLQNYPPCLSLLRTCISYGGRPCSIAW